MKSEFTDGFLANLKKLGPLMADNLVPVTITSGRMWRDASSKLDIGLNVDATLWFVVPHSFHRMTVEELLRMYAAGDRKSVFNLLLLAGGAVVPRGMPWVADIERLVHTDPRDEEIKRLREIISRNKARYVALQEELKTIRSELNFLKDVARELKNANKNSFETGEA